MDYVFSAGLILGLFLLVLVRRHIVSWSRWSAAAALIGCAFYGGLPFILLRLGAIQGGALRIIFAGMYLFAFTIVGSLVLNSRNERRARNEL